MDALRNENFTESFRVFRHISSIICSEFNGGSEARSHSICLSVRKCSQCSIVRNAQTKLAEIAMKDDEEEEEEEGVISLLLKNLTFELIF